MKKFLFKSILIIVSILIILSVTCISAFAVSSEDKIVLKKSDTEYLIYYKDILNQEFEFAFNTSASANESDLVFTKCAKDQAENGVNIAYIDSNFYNTYFNSSKKAYIWVKNSNDEVVVKADLIDLASALDNSMLDLANTTTGRIKTNENGNNMYKQVVNGVETIVTKGKMTIEPKQNAKYQYLILKANDEASNAGKLYSLAEQLKLASDTYTKLKVSKEFYNLYVSLVPQDSGWDDVNGTEILEPDDAQQGDKYVVFLKESVDGKTTTDAKFLTCGKTETENKTQAEEKYFETVSLPVTFDSGIILFIALAVIILVLAVFIVIRRKIGKKENK